MYFILLTYIIHDSQTMKIKTLFGRITAKNNHKNLFGNIIVKNNHKNLFGRIIVKNRYLLILIRNVRFLCEQLYIHHVL